MESIILTLWYKCNHIEEFYNSYKIAFPAGLRSESSSVHPDVILFIFLTNIKAILHWSYRKCRQACCFSQSNASIVKSHDAYDATI